MVISLLFFQYVILLNGGLTQGIIFMCLLISPCVFSYKVTRASSVLVGNRSHASVRGASTIDLKFTLRMIVQHVPSITKNLVNDSPLCQDGFKLAFISNKVLLHKYGQFIGKGYQCGGSFHLSLSNFYN